MWLYLYAVFGLLIVYLANNVRLLLRNIAIAKQSGLPYLITPWYFLNRFWMIQARLWLPLLHKLPETLKFPWVYLLEPDWNFKTKRLIYDHVKCDAFVIASPANVACFIADAEAVSTITTRRNDFPKPIELYASVDIFGKNVVTTEGSVWRHHRKITSPPFTEKNNHLVWAESLYQGQAMVEAWMGSGKKAKVASEVVVELAAATMRLSLHVISRAGFGVRLFWPHEEVEQGQEGHGELRGGHTLSYKDALSSLLENLIAVILFPKWFLKYAPFEFTKVAYEALTNWGQYMQEMYDEKKAEIAAGETTKGMDLMGAMVRGAGVVQPHSKSSSASEKGGGTAPGALLSDSEILGNAFVFILAGHETAANTINFSILQLALNPRSQRRLQKDLDGIFGDRPISQWSYDEDVPKLFGSMAGAVMNEELRLFPPVVGIPKQVAPNNGLQSLMVRGRRVVLPPGAPVTLNTLGLHTDPRNWPALVSGPDASDAEFGADLVSFKPERWLLDGSVKTYFHESSPFHHHDNSASVSTSARDLKPSLSSSSSSTRPAPAAPTADEDHSLGVQTTSDTSPSLYKPPRGAYCPFSEGYRACLGRRFAQVEVLAVLAVVFREYSVELAVEDVLGPDFPFHKGGVERVVSDTVATAAAVAALGGEGGRGVAEGGLAGTGAGLSSSSTSTSTSTSTSSFGNERLEKGTVRAQPLREDVTREEWTRARDLAHGLFDTAMGSIITLQMREGKVPVRFVRRGHERFKDF